MKIISMILVILVLGCNDKGNNSKFSSNGTINGNDSINIIELRRKANDAYDFKNFSVAIDYFNILIELDTSMVDMYFKRAYCFALIGDLESSTTDYLKSIDLGYRVADSFFNIGLNYQIVFDDSTALLFYRKALKLSPTDSKIIEQIDSCEFRLKSSLQII